MRRAKTEILSLLKFVFLRVLALPREILLSDLLCGGGKRYGGGRHVAGLLPAYRKRLRGRTLHEFEDAESMAQFQCYFYRG
jgi:hypothetical protein